MEHAARDDLLAHVRWLVTHDKSHKTKRLVVIVTLFSIIVFCLMKCLVRNENDKNISLMIHLKMDLDTD